MATRLAGKRHPEQGQIGGREEWDTGAAPRRSARSEPSGRPHEARSDPGPREMITAASSARTKRHRIRLTVRLPHALINISSPLSSNQPPYRRTTSQFQLVELVCFVAEFNHQRIFPCQPAHSFYFISMSCRNECMAWLLPSAIVKVERTPLTKKRLHPGHNRSLARRPETE